MPKAIAINRSLEDLEFLTARWSTESHTFFATWGEFFSTLEDVVVMTGLPVFGEIRAVKLPKESL